MGTPGPTGRVWSAVGTAVRTGLRISAVIVAVVLPSTVLGAATIKLTPAHASLVTLVMAAAAFISGLLLAPVLRRWVTRAGPREADV